jgi:hypothetical protein
MQTTQTPRPIDWDAHTEEKYTFWGTSTDAQPNTPKSKYNGAVLGEFASATIVYLHSGSGVYPPISIQNLSEFETPKPYVWRTSFDISGYSLPVFHAHTKEECLAHILSVFEQHGLKPLISYLPSQPRPTVRGDWSMQIK